MLVHKYAFYFAPKSVKEKRSCPISACFMKRKLVNNSVLSVIGTRTVILRQTRVCCSHENSVLCIA